MEDYLKVGIITTTHGVRGEVKVYPVTDDPRRFLDLDFVLMDTGKERLRLQIENVKFFKNMVILKFEGLDNVDDVVKFRQKELWIPREMGAPLNENEYYIADLLGMKVFLETGEEYGVLRDVMQTGANDVYIIDKKDGKEILIPAIHDCVKEVDIEAGRMTIHLMKGLE